MDLNYNNFGLQLDSIERFMGYESSKYKSIYMVTKPLPKLEGEKIGELILKLERKKNRYRQFLLFIISRLFVNLSLSQIKTTNKVQIILNKVPQEVFKRFKYMQYIPVLNMLIEIEKVVTKVVAADSITRVLNENYEKPFSIENVDQVKKNYIEKNHDVKREVQKIEKLFEKINYQKEYIIQNLK